MKLVVLTSLTMIAFAANSVFCRLALVDTANDALSFTLVRILSGAAILSIFFFRSKEPSKTNLEIKSLLAPLMLFSYALFFSLSYVKIDAGTGALILFASVQLTMMASAYLRGQRLRGYEKIGVLLAICGFVYLLLPGLDIPPLVAATFMIISGVSWGIYSLLGQGESNPIFSTSRNFLFAVPIGVALILVLSLLIIELLVRKNAINQKKANRSPFSDPSLAVHGPGGDLVSGGCPQPLQAGLSSFQLSVRKCQNHRFYKFDRVRGLLRVNLDDSELSISPHPLVFPAVCAKYREWLPPSRGFPSLPLCRWDQRLHRGGCNHRLSRWAVRLGWTQRTALW